MTRTAAPAATPTHDAAPAANRRPARPWWAQTTTKVVIVLGIAVYVLMHTLVIATPDEPAPLERAATAVKARLDPYPRSSDAALIARYCAPYAQGPDGRAIENPDYDQGQCVALGQAATGRWLATIPAAEGHGTCPLATRHACRAALGLPQTMETADWWAPWQTPNGAERLAFCIGLAAIAAVAVTLTSGLSGRVTLAWAAVIGYTACLPGLLQDPAADPAWNPLWTRLAAVAVLAGFAGTVVRGIRAGTVAAPRLTAVRARLTRRSTR